MIKKLDDTLFTNDAIIFINKGSNNLKFFGGEMVTLSVDLGKNNLDDVTFDEDDCQSTTHIQLMVWNRYKQYRFNRYKQRK